MGFLDVDKLVKLCRTTKWSTYKIWQAVKAGELAYKEATYLRHEMLVRDALKFMVQSKTKFAVIKRGDREVGMVGESRLRETLNWRGINEQTEESKEIGYFEQMSNKIKDWRTSKVNSSRDSLQ